MCTQKRISQLKGRIVSKLVGNAKSYVANNIAIINKDHDLDFYAGDIVFKSSREPTILTEILRALSESLRQMPENYISY